MVKSRLIQVLRTFSKKETREFKKWLSSPLHNQRADLIALHKYLFQENNLMRDEFLAKELAYSYIFPQSDYDDAKMRQVMHFFYKNVEEFLAYTYFINDSLNSKITLAKVYRQRKLDRSFLKVKKELENNFEDNQNQNEELAFKKFKFQQEVYNYKVEIKRTQGLDLQILTDTFDEAYIEEKLKQGCLINSHKRVYKIDYDEGLLKDVIQYIQSKQLIEKPRIGIYYYAYKITSPEGSTHDFFLLKNIIENNENFSNTELRDIYLFAINFCISQINAGNKQFFEEVFGLYKNGIEKNIFIENNVLSRWTFKNAISAGLALKKYDWVENFIENFNHYLKETYRESFVNYSYVKLYFEKGDYDNALEIFQRSSFNDLLTNIDSKIIQLKIYYEKDEHRLIESLLESMRAYLQRKKVLGYHKSNYKNIIRYTKKLLKVNPYSKAQKEKLKAEIETAKPLTEKAWLLKQLENL